MQQYLYANIAAYYFCYKLKKGNSTISSYEYSYYLDGSDACKKRNESGIIVATHNNTEHIHNHIIINSVNLMKGKSFSREHNRKSYPAWKRLRKISNNITTEKGLSVIRNPDNSRRGHDTCF